MDRCRELARAEAVSSRWAGQGVGGLALLPLDLEVLCAPVRVDLLFGKVVCSGAGNYERAPTNPAGVRGAGGEREVRWGRYQKDLTYVIVSNTHLAADGTVRERGRRYSIHSC